MNKLNFKFKGGKLRDLLIHIDDNQVILKKSKFNALEGSYETENTAVNIKIFRCLEVQSRFWFLWQMLFFFVSIFGIFDRRLDKKCLVLDAEFNVAVDENTNIEFALDYLTKDRVLTYNSTGTVTEIKNMSYIDTKAKKRLKALKLTKIFTTIGCAFVAVLLIVLLT